MPILYGEPLSQNPLPRDKGDTGDELSIRDDELKSLHTEASNAAARRIRAKTGDIFGAARLFDPEGNPADQLNNALDQAIAEDDNENE